MDLLDNAKYLAMINKIYERFPDWKAFDGKTICLTGASGMIGSVLVDALMLRNSMQPEGSRCKIVGLGRDEKTARMRFSRWFNCDEFVFIAHDISKVFHTELPPADYYIHAASTTHPRAYSSEPINTILSNIFGTHNMLELVSQQKKARLLLLSSVEIYGENRDDTKYFTEEYCGYIDCNTLRAGYPEAKRASEALCQAYIQQKAVDATIIRLPRTYGPSMRLTDSKAIAQFIIKGVHNEQIVLKSEGNQLYSYIHVADAVTALLYVLVHGQTGEAYNVGDSTSDITLKDLAKFIAESVGTKVVFEMPDLAEKQGYSTVTKALMDASKLKRLGWAAQYTISQGITETIQIIRERLEIDKVDDICLGKNNA